MAKICKHCGEELEDNAVFCYNCKHNPDEKKKKGKLWLIIAALAVFVIGAVIIVVSCSPAAKGMKFIRVGDIDKVKDAKTKNLIDSLSYLSECDDDDYICILTDKASGSVIVPDYYKGERVSYVTAYPDEGKKIKSLQVNCPYLEYVCDFDDENDTLTSVKSKFEHGYISGCFNNCTALNDADFSDVWRLKGSFCNCDGLEELVDFDDRYFSQEEPYYMIETSYRECDSLTEVKLEKFSRFTGNFDGCGSLKTVELNGDSDAFESCFNDCSDLETVTMQVNTSTITDSFNRCPCLTSVSLHGASVAEESFNDNAKLENLYAGMDRFNDSFNNCTALKTIELVDRIQSLTNSFENCGVDINSVKSNIQSTDEKIEHNKTRWKEIKEKFGLAIKKLGDNGVVAQPVCVSDGYTYKLNEMVYDENYLLKTNDTDHLAFLDKEAQARLTAKPDLSDEKVTFDYGKERYQRLEMEKQLKDPGIITDQADECRYYICVRGYRGVVEEDYYNDGSDRVHMTTAVVIYDVKKDEIIHIKEIGIDFPGESTVSTYTTGGILYQDASDYILSLYQ